MGLPESPPASFEVGVRQFQCGEFYQCHDTLEALWIEAQEPDKTFLQGILQIAVACYHLSNQNWRGAVILLGEGARRLADYCPSYWAVDVDELYESSLSMLQWLQQQGPERVADCCQQLLVAQTSGQPTDCPLPTLRYSG